MNQDILDRASEAVDLAISRREYLNGVAAEESKRLFAMRDRQRRELKGSMASEQQWYDHQMASAFRDRKQRWAQRTQGSPFSNDLVSEFKSAERRVGRAGQHLSRTASGDQRFRTHLVSAFVSRTLQRDEMAELRTEKRELLAQERELRSLMEAERSRMKQALAARRQTNVAEEAQAKREQKMEEAMLKQEFFRSLTGWNGRKTTTRTQSLKHLWDDHRQRLVRSHSAAGVRAPGADALEWEEPMQFGLEAEEPPAEP
uniref:Uncharacterized protein n=1 Tax=Zooxanthella nutricula TaxID=1333877 RepID=A0A7S2KU76_9DINO